MMDKTVYYGASNQELVVTHEVEKNKDAHLEINNTGQIHCPITGDEYKILKIKSLNYAIRSDYVDIIKKKLAAFFIDV